MIGVNVATVAFVVALTIIGTALPLALLAALLLRAGYLRIRCYQPPTRGSM